MTALTATAQSFLHLLIARMGLGAAEAGCIPSSQSIIADYVPLKRRSSAYAVHGLGMQAGAMLGLILAGWLGATIGWRWTIVVLGLPGLAIALLVRLTLREPVRGASDALHDDEGTPPLRETIATLWACRTYRWVVTVFVLNGFATMGLMQWWPSFYVRCSSKVCHRSECT